VGEQQKKKILSPQQPSCPLLSSSSNDQTFNPGFIPQTFQKRVRSEYDTTVTGSVLIYSFSEPSQKNSTQKKLKTTKKIPIPTSIFRKPKKRPTKKPPPHPRTKHLSWKTLLSRFPV
jgi:hypothetical protein